MAPEETYREPLAVRVLRCALAFVLAFSFTFAAQQLAWADDEDTDNLEQLEPADGGDNEGEQSEPEPTEPEPTDPDPAVGPDETGGEGDNPQPGDGEEEPSPSVMAIELWVTPNLGAGTPVANSWDNADTPPAEHGAIAAKGESLVFQVLPIWDDGSAADSFAGEGYGISWAIDNEEIASATTGTPVCTLTPKANGSVTLTAICEPEEGVRLTARYTIDITGQNDELYIADEDGAPGIRIVDEDGNPFPDTGLTLPDLNSTANLAALVRVANPAQGTVDELLVTRAHGLAEQTGGALADLVWQIDGDDKLGTVDAASGVYRPAVYGARVTVSAVSRAGLGGATVRGSVRIATIAPDDQSDGRFPQDKVTIRVFYEDVPDQIVKEVTLTRAEVEALGCEEHSYTAVGRGTFATASARGVPFARVLEAAGANLQGISYFSFGTADSGGGAYGETVSWQILFGQTRYYYPNYAVGENTTGGVAVPPLLAVESNFRWFNSLTGLGEEEDYSSMTDDTCFRLLFGATPGGQTTTNKQIYWIHTINVVLAGGPPTQNGNGDGNGSGTQGDGSGSGQGGSEGAKDSGSPAATQTGIQTTAPTSAAQGQAEEASSPEQEDADEPDGDASGEEGRWSVYQIMNPYASNVDAPELENPWKPLAAPLAAGTTAAGATSAAARYRRQKRPLRKTR